MLLGVIFIKKLPRKSKVKFLALDYFPPMISIIIIWFVCCEHFEDTINIVLKCVKYIPLSAHFRVFIY